MNLLAFDTSTDTLFIAVQRGEGALARTWQHTGPGGAQASATLIPAILQLMQQAGLAFSDLTAIVYGRGPGSFTGLRTACSVAQGLAFGASAPGVPVLPVDTLLAVAEEARFQFTASERLAGQPERAAVYVTAMLDARMDEVYLQNYFFEADTWTSQGECKVLPPEAVALPRLGSVPLGPATAQPLVLLAGNVFTTYAERLPGASFTGGRVAGGLNESGVNAEGSTSEALGAADLQQAVASGSVRWSALPCAAALLRLAPAMLRAGLGVPAEQALPLYIRDKVAQTTEERLVAKARLQALPEATKSATPPAPPKSPQPPPNSP